MQESNLLRVYRTYCFFTVLNCVVAFQLTP